MGQNKDKTKRDKYGQSANTTTGQRVVKTHKVRIFDHDTPAMKERRKQVSNWDFQI